MALPRSPHHSQDSTRAPPHLPSNPLQVHHQASGLGLPQSLPRQNVLEQPWLWTAATAGISSGPEAPTCMTEPAADSEQHSQMSSTPSSHKKSTAKRKSPAGQELDIQPGVEHSCLYRSFFFTCIHRCLCLCVVSLLCSADGSDSTTGSRQVSRKKRGKSKHTFSEGEGHSSSE